jgi:hypothetical protein
MKIYERDLGLSSHEANDIKDLKNRGVIGGSVSRSLYRQLIQPIKDLVNPAYEY